ncbi:MAG: Hsp20/alpha crystallin family protein [Desulfobacteraceae bacterium]|nr:Hsp20/alpha crystallin family protein [Desulfobacteraceae bacterium]MCF8093735.1 Hsp20/alpha crystallin family protein [Desulfobacteraceae bacterium]
MDYIKIRFTNDFDDSGPGRSMSELFQSMSPMFAFSKTTWKPQLDIYETSEKIYVTAEIPGVEKEDLELEVSPRAIRISGKRTGAPPAANGRYRLAEIQYGPFERILHLKTPVDTENITAKYKNGFLYVEITKLPHRTRQNIPINTE